MDALFTSHKEHQNRNVPVVDRGEVQCVVGEGVLGEVVGVRLGDEGVLAIGEVEAAVEGADVEVDLVLGEAEEEAAAETLILHGRGGFAVVAESVCIQGRSGVGKDDSHGNRPFTELR